MSDVTVYSPDELSEIRKFLNANFQIASSEMHFASAPNAAAEVDPEVNRLSKKTRRREPSPKLSDSDMDELKEWVLQNEFFRLAKGDTNVRLAEMERDAQAQLSAGSKSLPLLLLKNFVQKFCGKSQSPGYSRIAITTAGLGAIMHHLGLDAVLAPVAVWFATYTRDVGGATFCIAAQEYLSGKGLSVSHDPPTKQ